MPDLVLEADAGLFFCPIPSVIHPEVDALDQRALGWLNELGLCADPRQRARALANKSAELFARTTPEAAIDRIQIAVDWIHYGFIFDDLVADTRVSEAGPEAGSFVILAAKIARMVETLDPSLAEKAPVLRPMHDIARRVAACSTRVQRRRWVDAVRLWMFGLTQQRVLDARGAVPSLDTYLTMRLHDCGGAPITALLEIANDAEVPGHELDSPAVRALTEASWLIAALDNERVSRAKETYGEALKQNLVNVLMKDRGVHAVEASRALVAMRDRMMCLFLRLRAQVLDRASPALRRYLLDLGHRIRGNIEWSMGSARYTTVYGADGQPVGTAKISHAFTPDPVDGSLDPLPIPAIAWWWNEVRC